MGLTNILFFHLGITLHEGLALDQCKSITNLKHAAKRYSLPITTTNLKKNNLLVF
jgi:hypothetical protein